MAHKLLLADDSITIQKVVSLTFAEEDFDVTCVGNGEIALEKIREARPDIILADIFMPRKTGYEVCEFVKSSPLYQHIPVILLVGTFEPFDKNEAARVRSDGYLTKPFETTALVKLVRQTLAKAGPAPAAPPAPPARAAEADMTLQVPLEDLKRRFEQTRPARLQPAGGRSGRNPGDPPRAAGPRGVRGDGHLPDGRPGRRPGSGRSDSGLRGGAGDPAPRRRQPLHSAQTVTMPPPAPRPALPPMPVPELVMEPVLAAIPDAPPAEETLSRSRSSSGRFVCLRTRTSWESRPDQPRRHHRQAARLEEAVRLEQESRRAPVITAPEPEIEPPAEYRGGTGVGERGSPL